MTTTTTDVLDSSNNVRQTPELIEVPPETLAKIENVPENENNQLPLIVNKCLKWLKIYVKKFLGLHETRPKRLSYQEYFWSFIGAFIGIASVAFIHHRVLEERQLAFLIGSFGASAVLIFGAPRSPLAQPRNFLGGHLISAICGCTVRIAIDRFEHSVACALAVAIAIVAMQLTETTHPPGGATALLAVTTRPALPWAHFLFILMPVLTGALTMLIVALVINNMAPKRTYPSFWW